MSTKINHKYDFSEIIKRMMEVKGWSQDKDVASALGMKPVAFSERKSRNSPPIDKIKVWCASEFVNPNWVLTGDGNPERIKGITDIDPVPVMQPDPSSMTLEQKLDFIGLPARQKRLLLEAGKLSEAEQEEEVKRLCMQNIENGRY